MNGSANQQMMPKTRLRIAVVLVVRAGMFMVISEVEFDALRQRQCVGIVYRIGLPAHVGFPRIGTGFAAAAGFLLAAKSATDFRAAGADIDVGNSAVGTG